MLSSLMFASYFPLGLLREDIITEYRWIVNFIQVEAQVASLLVCNCPAITKPLEWITSFHGLILKVLPSGTLQTSSRVQTTSRPKSCDLTIDLIPTAALIHVHCTREVCIKVCFPRCECT